MGEASGFATCDILTAVLQVTPSRRVSSSMLYPDDRGTAIFRNVGRTRPTAQRHIPEDVNVQFPNFLRV